MRVMLADDLADRAKLFGGAEVRTRPPYDLAVASDDGPQACFAAADDAFVRREPHVALVDVLVRADVGGGVDVQPVVAGAWRVERARGLVRCPRVRRKPELVDVV